MERGGWLIFVLVLLAGISLQGCAHPELPGGDNLLAEKLASKPVRATYAAQSTAAIGDASGPKFDGAYVPGSDKFVGASFALLGMSGGSAVAALPAQTSPGMIDPSGESTGPDWPAYQPHAGLSLG